MLQIRDEILCEHCFENTKVYPCPRCGYNGDDSGRHAVALPKGSILQGKYVIGKMLGKGGFGITYLAYDYTKKTRVAVKEYYPSGMVYRQPGSASVENEKTSTDALEEGEEKFYSEAKTISKLNKNGNVVKVYEFFKENNTSYFVMEYLEGCDLKEFIAQNGLLSEGQAITVISAVCSALEDVHKNGILHRDISPDNIFVCNDGRIILIDFGAARQLAAEKSQSMSVILKQGFAPIEQYQRKSHHGPWSDVYALGSSIYYSLSAQLPDDAITRMASPEIDFSKNPSLSQGFKDILSKMMAVNVSDRYADTKEVMADINALDAKPLPLIIGTEAAAIKKPLLPDGEKKGESYVPQSEEFGKEKTKPVGNPEEKNKKKTKVLSFIIGGFLLTVIIIAVILLSKGCSGDGPSDVGGGNAQSDIPQSEVTHPAADETGKTEETAPETDAETIDSSKYIQTAGMSSVNNPACGIVKCDKETAELDSQVTLTAVPNAGYKFIGWTDGEMTPERTVMANYESFFVAQFEPMTLTVSFNEGNAAPVSVTFGEMYGQLPTPTRANSIFVGWFDAPTGGNMITSGSTVTNASDHTLYARYDAVVLSYLRITSTNHKTSYIVGEKIDTSNLKLTAVYSDGSEKNVTGFMTNPVNGTAVTQSMNKITVSYEGKTLEYGISVASEAATKLEIVSVPSKTTYFEGDKLNTSGLKIKVTYNNGTTKTVSSGFATTPSNGATLSTSNTKVTVSYGGKTTSYNITVTPVQTAEVILSGDGYKLTSDGTLTITNNNAMKDYSSYSGIPWYGQQGNIKKVIIQNGVTRIGDRAFSMCSSLTSVTIPNSVTSIGDYAFYYCGSLTSVTIPNSVTSIGSYAFSLCSSLTSVTIPNSVTSIGSYAFFDCDSLTSVTIPNSVTSIGSYAFSLCSSLTSVTIPNSVTSIGDWAFFSCDSLTAINVSSGNANYTSVDGVLFNKNKTTLIQYPGGKQGAYTIPNSVTSIGNYAFYDCDSLTSVTIPNSVTSIGSDAFSWCVSLTSVTIPNSVTSIGSYAFSYCDSLTSVTIPNSVTSIGNAAFRYCDSLASVTIPNSVTRIGERAFSSCSSLETINFKGTQAQWNAISKGTGWDEYTGNYTIKYSG